MVPELDELLDEELDEDELLEEELLDDELLVDDELLDDELELLLDELLPVGAPDEPLPPHPTRSMHAASAPPVRLSTLLIANILFFQPQVLVFLTNQNCPVPAGDLINLGTVVPDPNCCRLMRLLNDPSNS
jgi:hypothetical protein